MATTGHKSACVELCDPSASVACAAAQRLRNFIGASQSKELEAGFDHIIAPLLARLADKSSAESLLEECLLTLSKLLGKVQPTGVPVARSRRVFPLIMERLLPMLEQPTLAEEVVANILECAGVVLRDWYKWCDRAVELTRMQLGFLAHLAVQFIHDAHRDCRLQSIELLNSIPQVEDSADILACFFPGVSIALVKIILHSDFKLGSKVVVASTNAWREWIVHVLGDIANNKGVVKRTLTLTDLFYGYNRKEVPDPGKQQTSSRAKAGGAAAALPTVETMGARRAVACRDKCSYGRSTMRCAAQSREPSCCNVGRKSECPTQPYRTECGSARTLPHHPSWKGARLLLRDSSQWSFR